MDTSPELLQKKVAVIKITTPTNNVLVAPAPTKARTISNVEIGAAKISYIVPLNFGKKYQTKYY